VTPEAEREYAEIRELIRQSEERQKKFEARSIRDYERALRRMEVAEKRMDLADERWKKRWAAADERMDKFDKQLLVTKKLVEAGMKMVMRITTRLDRVAKTQEAFLRSSGNGHNRGNGHNGRKRGP